MQKFTQKLSDQDLRKALRIHYFGYKYTLITPIMGAAVSLYLLYLIINSPWPPEPTMWLLLIAGAFFILRPRLYINRILSNIKSQKMFAGSMSIELTEDERIIATAGDSMSVMPLKDLYGFTNRQDFLHLYLAKNNFLILDKREMSETMLEKLISLLEKHAIRKR